MDFLEGKTIMKVEEVIVHLQRLFPYLSDDQVAMMLSNLEREKKIAISRPQEEKSFIDFMTNNYSSIPFWLIAILVGVTLSTLYIIPQTGLFSIIRIVCGGLFVLFLPGYSVLGFLFPDKNLGPVEKIGLSIVLSLAITILIGLILNFGSEGIGLDAIAFSLCGLVLALSLSSTFRAFYSRTHSNEVLMLRDG